MTSPEWFFKWLSGARTEIIVFIAGFVIFTLGAFEFQDEAGSLRLSVATSPSPWLLSIGSALMFFGILLIAYAKRLSALEGARSKSSVLDDFQDLIEKEPKEIQAALNRKKETKRDPTDLDREVAEELRLQEERLSAISRKRSASEEAKNLRRERDHKLVQLVSEAHLDPDSDSYEQRIYDRYLAVGATSKAILKTLYKHSPEDEVSCDVIFERHKKDENHVVHSRSEMYHRVMMLAFLSLVDVKAVGPRNTVVKKVIDVKDILTNKQAFDS